MSIAAQYENGVFEEVNGAAKARCTGILGCSSFCTSIAFNASAESWLNQQLQYDLWHAERNRKHLHVSRLSAA